MSLKPALSIAAAASVAIAGSAAAADAALTPGQRALDGYWRIANPPPPPGGAPRSRIEGGPPPPDGLAVRAIPLLTPAAAEAHAKFQAAEAAGLQQRTPSNLCIPSEIPGGGVPGGPAYQIEIQLEPKLAAFLYEENRTIRLARIGASHPPGLKPSWLGHSVARWEGDTLVVDTVGFNDRNVIGPGIPVSHDLHVVQRLRVVDGQLEDQATFVDPAVFTAPLTVTTRLARGTPFQEYICAENNNEGGVPTADGKATRATFK